MARDRKVAMTEAEVNRMLDEQHTITLATIGPDGLPHLAAMWFVRDGEELLLWTYATSQKARNLERDARASVLAEAGESYDELRGVCLDCEVDIVRDPEEVLQAGRILKGRNITPGKNQSSMEEDALRAQAAKRIALRMKVVRTRSWDHRKLQQSST
jgi:PPOX class probable F420-dependent enzyme